MNSTTEKTATPSSTTSCQGPSSVAPNRLQVIEYVKSEFSEIYLLIDHLARSADKRLDEALPTLTLDAKTITLQEICGVALSLPDVKQPDTLARAITAKDRLSRAAYPATGRSIAFTYLSLNPEPGPLLGRLRQGLIGGVVRILQRVLPWRYHDGTYNARTRGYANDAVMLQFARDAFPELMTKQRWLVHRVTVAGWSLFVLLLMTSYVIWNLAVGQRMLADYRWLSLHPQTMQLDGTLDPTCFSSRELQPGGLCARALAFERVQPAMENWTASRGLLKRLVAVPEPQPAQPPSTLRYDPQCQGRLLEITRLLVTTLNYDVLPPLVGALAAIAAALRMIGRKTAAHELEPRDLMFIPERVLLGAFLGASIGLLTAPGASNGLFTLIGGLPEETSNTVALSPPAFAFLMGFATSRVFAWLDSLAERIFPVANAK